MAKRAQIYRHYNNYSLSSDTKIINKWDVQAGQIVTFRYKSHIQKLKDRRPLLFVLDTDEYNPDPTIRALHGVNLNYIPEGEVEKMFLRILERVGWDIHKQTGFPRVDVWDEADTKAMRPVILYNTIIKPFVMPRFHCWRTYKYRTITTVEAVKYNFDAKPLVEASSKANSSPISKSKMNYYLHRTINNKYSAFYRSKDYKELLKDWKERGIKLSEEEIKKYEQLFTNRDI